MLLILWKQDGALSSLLRGLTLVLVVSFVSANAYAEDNAIDMLARGLNYLKEGNNRAAIDVLSAALRIAEPESRPRIVELLGIAHERSGQTTRARFVYEQYLQDNPVSDQTAVIQQRLDALIGRALDTVQPLRPIEASVYTQVVEQQQTVLSTYYYDTHTRGTASANSDYGYGGSDVAYQWRRKAGEQEQYFQFRVDGSADSDSSINDGRFRVRKFSYQFDENALGFSTTLGRQSSTSAAIGGDVDGVRLVQRLYRRFSLHAVHGVPVYHYELKDYDSTARVTMLAMRYGEFKNSNYLETYLARRTLGSIENRQAVGANAAISTAAYSLQIGTDYDLKFATLNLLTSQAQWMPRNSVLVYGAADYRKTPFVSLENSMWYVERTLSLQQRIEQEGVTKLIEEARLNTGNSRYITIGTNVSFLSDYSAELSVTRSKYHYSFPDTQNGGRINFDEQQDDVMAGLGVSNLFGGGTGLMWRVRLAYADSFDSHEASLLVRQQLNPQFRLLPRFTVMQREHLNGASMRTLEPAMTLEYQRKAISARLEGGISTTNHQSADELNSTRTFVSASFVTQF